ncbi:hypothetical protein AK812_SmicGene26162 [Symbiodinium microadriaticum]|uniref:Uncharacterized protein n=1 Tax=Symbiodinium microadriaticum TaxID=2951 RepID=A0A1Q9DA48_SYMMI|nr:hypothetical protein AK812_SmicGene26162 [Symbiodinium microadriaticum]CAE7725402.1 unnamed protein product [Symbiodinium microadriaticum]CAE7861274.1 unnamed protein product [Symbiodinium sp. KB8]
MSRQKLRLWALLVTLSESNSCIQSPHPVLLDDNHASECAAALLQKQAEKVEHRTTAPPQFKEDAEWRARQMVLQNAEEEAVAQSLSRFMGWFSNVKISSPIQLPLIRQWHAVSQQLLDRGLTASDLRVIFVCLFACLILTCAVAGRRLAGTGT